MELQKKKKKKKRERKKTPVHVYQHECEPVNLIWIMIVMRIARTYYVVPKHMYQLGVLSSARLAIQSDAMQELLFIA